MILHGYFSNTKAGKTNRKLPNGREAAANAIKGCGPQPSDLCRIFEDAPPCTRNVQRNRVRSKAPEKTISHRFILPLLPSFLVMVTNVSGVFPTLPFFHDAILHSLNFFGGILCRFFFLPERKRVTCLEKENC